MKKEEENTVAENLMIQKMNELYSAVKERIANDILNQGSSKIILYSNENKVIDNGEILGLNHNIKFIKAKLETEGYKIDIIKKDSSKNKLEYTKFLYAILDTISTREMKFDVKTKEYIYRKFTFKPIELNYVIVNSEALDTFDEKINHIFSILNRDLFYLKNFKSFAVPEAVGEMVNVSEMTNHEFFEFTNCEDPTLFYKLYEDENEDDLMKGLLRSVSNE